MQKSQSIDIDKLADALEMTPTDLKMSIEFFDLMQIANEALRLSQAEAFDKNKLQQFIDGGSRFTDKSLVEACRALLPAIEVVDESHIPY